MNKLKIIAFLLVTIVVSSVVVSCKAQHELCPAYSQVNSEISEQAN